MTLERAPELLQTQVGMGGGYNRNAARLILREIQLEHRQAAVDDPMRALDLRGVFGLSPGTDFSNVV